MNISGLVVSCSSAVEPIRHAITSAGPFTLGEQFGPRLAVALEVPDDLTGQAWVEWLLALPGVAKVDVAFVAFHSDSELASTCCEDSDHV